VSPEITLLDFCFVGLTKSEAYKTKADARDELRADILDADTSMKKREDQLRRTTRDLRTRVEKFIEGYDGFWDIY
jgi:hypothetical protein